MRRACRGDLSGDLSSVVLTLEEVLAKVEARQSEDGPVRHS
jgi:hypothetical protein